MKNKNIFKRTFLILILIIIPLMTTIGAAAWVLLYEERITPIYNPDSAFYYYLNGQSVTYDGDPHFPSPKDPITGLFDSTLINLEKESITWKCFRNEGTTQEPNFVIYKTGVTKPQDPGEYLIRFSDKTDQTNGGYPASDIIFTIEKPKINVQSWPSLDEMYWGEEYVFSSSNLGDTSNGSFSVVANSLRFPSDGDRSTPNLTFNVDILFTPNDISYYQTETKTTTVTVKAVAHVGNTFYATVDDAIKKTESGIIYVMLTDEGSDKAKTIGATTTNETITLATGVTLYVPYYMDTSTSPYTYNISLSETQSDPSNLQEYGELYHASAPNFADSVANNTNLKNYIIIDSDTTLSITNGATLQVTGITGSSSQGLQGHTSSLYSEIKMISGSKIDNFGLIICGGYIKEVKYNENNELIYTTYSKEVSTKPYLSEIIIRNSAEIRLPFVVSDYRGGTSTAGAYANTSAINVLGGNYTGNISPFSRYDFPNVQTRIKVIYGGFIKGYADLYTGAFKIDIPFIGEVGTDEQHNLTDIVAIGNTSDSLIQIESGTIVYCDCVPTNPGITTTSFNSRKTYISMIGTYGASLNYMLMEVNVVDTIAVTTEDVLFPVSDLFDISLSGGVYNINTGFKLLPGSSLTVNFGATLNVGSDFIVYSDFDDKAVISPKYPTKEQLGKAGADLIINGTLNINSGATFGGIVKTQGAQAKMNVNTTNLTITSKEGTGSRSGLSFVFNESNSITEKLKAYIYKNGTIDNYTTTLAQGTYYSKEGTPGNYGWYSDNATIYYNANGGTLNGSTSSGPYPTGSSGYQIKSDSIESNLIVPPIPSREHYTFAGWYLTQECNDSDVLFTWNGTKFTAKDYNMFVNTTLYAKWIPVEYTITYGNSYTFTGGSGSFSTNTNLTKFTYETANELLTKPIHENRYVFEGWYYTSDNTKLTMLNGSELVNYLSSNNVNIYAKWYPAGTETFTVNYVNERNDEIPCLESQDLIIETDASWSNYSLPNIGYNNNVTNYQYYFDGWYTTDGTLVTSLSEGLFSSSTSITLYAKWGEKYTVTLMNGESEVDSFYITPNSTFTLPSYTYPLELSSDKNYITEYVAYWNDGTNSYQGGTTSPAITSDITFNQTKTELVKYYKVTLTNYNTKVVLTITNGDLLTDTTDTKKTTYTFDNNTETAKSDVLFIKNGSSVQCVFTYYNSKYNGYELTKNGSVFKEDSSRRSTPSNPSAFTISSDIYGIGSSSGNASGGCVFSDAQILMADGSTKQVNEIKVGDMVTTWSFEEGKFVVRPVIFFEALDSVMVDKITLYFYDNTQLEIAYAQSFFDIDKLEYFSINADNVHEYVGINIMTHDNGKVSSKQIVDYKVEIVMEDVYEIITGYDYSFIYDNVLTMEPFMLYKLPFKINSDLKYDEELMKEDIEKYGLYTYDEWYMHGTEQMFDLMNVKYFKVAIEKGLYTLEYLLELYEYYFIPDNLN